MHCKVSQHAVEQFLVNILVKEHGLSPKGIKMDSLIATDLGVDGDDAWELLNEIEGHYNVDLSDVFETCFWPEAGLFKSRRVKPISVSRLAKIVCERQVATGPTL